jgi:hypothetical protein
MSVFSRDENCIFIKANEDTFNCRINTKGWKTRMKMLYVLSINTTAQKRWKKG